jgi:hypothetical protein
MCSANTFVSVACAIMLTAAWPAFSQPYNPQPHVQPASGPFNTLVTLSVSGQDPGGYTGFCVDGFAIGKSCGPGDCSLPHRMGYPVGPHTVSINCMSGPTFTVLPPTEFSISPSCFTAGSTVTLRGHHFGAASVVSFLWEGGFTDPGKVAFTDENGDFDVSFVAPAFGEGTHTVTATGPINLTARYFEGANCGVVGTATNLAGDVAIEHPDGTRSPLKNGDAIMFGDQLITKPAARADVNFTDGTELRMAENSSLRMDSYVYSPANPSTDGAVWNALQGAFQMVSGLIQKRPDDNVRMSTPAGGIGIRGTTFIARRDPCSVTQEVYLLHGQLSVTPRDTGDTNIVNAPATIHFTAGTVTVSSLTQAEYDAVAAQTLATNTSRSPFENWQLEFFGCTNHPSALPGADPDGDGASNQSEFQSGTNPTNAASVFRITSITRDNDTLTLTWKSHGGRTNVVQSASRPDGPYTNLSSNIRIEGNSDTVTNFVLIGGGSETNARYLRVRQVP